MTSPRTTLTAATLAALAFSVASSSALAAGWSTPATVLDGNVANPKALTAFGGSVGTGDFISPSAQLAKRNGDGFDPARVLYTPVTSERLWTGGSDSAGDTVILTVRRHLPYQRIRAVLISPQGVASAPRTISGKGHSATQPVVSVAPDGSAVAAWQWHDKAGWRAQAAIKPAHGGFGPAVTISDPSPQRPILSVAAGQGGAAAVTWQVAGAGTQADVPRYVVTAAAGMSFGPADVLDSAGGYSSVGLGVSTAGEVVVAYEPEYSLQKGDTATAQLFVATGTAGSPLGAASVIDSGGPGFVGETTPEVAFTGNGDALLGWISPTATGHGPGKLTIYTRPAGGTSFGTPQGITGPGIDPAGLTLAGGPGGRAVVAWFQTPEGAAHVQWAIHAAVRGAAGGPFAPETQINPVGELGLWPSVAITPSGDAVATWIVNTSGGGSGSVEASLLPAS